MKLLFRIACLILMLLVIPAIAVAQTEQGLSEPSSDRMMILPPDPGSIENLFGQNHWYTVVFRGNGEAVVSARITFANNDTAPINSLELRVPKIVPSDLMAYQVIQQGQCIQYDQKNCIQYQEPDMYNWYGQSSYQKATALYTGDSITVTLPKSIQPQKSGSVMLYFRAFGYAKKDIVGGRHFTFVTLQADTPVNQVQVGINTDSDLVLRGSKSEVNYRFEDSQMAIKGMAEASAPMVNTRMDSYMQQIGYGSIVKTASNLQAFESYSVRGSYADLQIKLYAKEISIGLGILILFVAIVYFITRRVTKTNQPSKLSTNVVAVFGLSFVSAILAVGYSAIVMFLVQNISSLVGYQSQAPIILLLLIISLGVYGLLLGGPAVFMGMKRGLWYGLATAGMTILWLVLTLIIYLMINMSGQNPIIYPMEVMRGLENSVDTQ